MSPNTNGVFWDNEFWEVDDDCSKFIIPTEESPESREWKRIRMSFDQGETECVPREGCLCGTPTRDCEVQNDGSIYLHTAAGTFSRTICHLVCPCGITTKWNPSHEFIHTIRHNKHGSE